jgi:hypothetical protein
VNEVSAMKPRVRFLVPVWGRRYIELFATLSLPSFLAPGNLPALAEQTDLEILILTSSKDHEHFEAEPAFRVLRSVAPVRFIAIDDLIVDQLYGVTLTLAYLRGITDTGPDMVSMHFLFMNADLVLADGSLLGVAKRILRGDRAILACSIRATSEDLEEPLRGLVDKERHVLAVPPRRLVSMAMQSLHPTQIAKIVNSDLCHSRYVNQFYWQVDDNTLISRHFLMFMLCLKPERIISEIQGFCDYAFVPEMCPSVVTVAMEDSDEFFFLEMQARESESDFLRIGRPSLGEVAESLSRWTTQHHRENSLNHTLIFHGSDIPKEAEAVQREAERFIRAIHERLDPTPKPYRQHPYWVGTLTNWEKRKALLAGNPGTIEVKAATKLRQERTGGIGQMLYRCMFGRPPFVTLFHPDWIDYRCVAATVQAHLSRSNKNILYASDHAGVFGEVLRGADTISIKRLLAEGIEEKNRSTGSLTLAMIEAERENLRHIRTITDVLRPFMAKDGQIVVFFKESGLWPGDMTDELMRLIGYIAPAELNRTHFAFAGGIWPRRVRSLFARSSRLYARHGPAALPFVAALILCGAVVAAVYNVSQAKIQDRRTSIRHCSSFGLILDC